MLLAMGRHAAAAAAAANALDYELYAGLSAAEHADILAGSHYATPPQYIAYRQRGADFAIDASRHYNASRFMLLPHNALISGYPPPSPIPLL
jgi:hypothetical protein